MATRYDVIPRALWRYLSVALRALDADLSALETNAGLAYNPTEAEIDAMPPGTIYVTGP